MICKWRELLMTSKSAWATRGAGFLKALPGAKPSCVFVGLDVLVDEFDEAVFGEVAHDLVDRLAAFEQDHGGDAAD